jgi:hypothetical protein
MEAVRNAGPMVRYTRYLHGLDESSSFGECFLQYKLIRIERGTTESNAASIAEYFQKEATEHVNHRTSGAIIPEEAQTVLRGRRRIRCSMPDCRDDVSK